MDELMTASTAAVAVKGLSKSYETSSGAVDVIDDLTFDVQEGSFLSIVGPSGCGKSTLLRIIAGLTSRTTGDVIVDQNVVTSPIRGCGFVFQSSVLLEWRTVLDNVLLPIEILRRSRRAAVDRALELLAMAGLADFVNRYPHELSGGMQQRVSICRALITDPQLLLMDEPFGALDALTREDMGNALLRIWEETGKTVLFVTHSIDEAVYLSDRVIVMGRRPSSIRAALDIDLPRPRSDETRLTAKFNECGDLIRHAIRTA